MRRWGKRVRLESSAVTKDGFQGLMLRYLQTQRDMFISLEKLLLLHRLGLVKPIRLVHRLDRLAQDIESNDLVNHIGSVFQYIIVDVVDPGYTLDVAVRP
ncbi:hypothetical protein YC2023_099680 [Brassica napus]